MIVLSEEYESQFRDLEEQFIGDFYPRDIAESSIIRELATIVWKKLRLEKLEQPSFLRTMNAPLTDCGIHFNAEIFAFYLRRLIMMKEESKAQESRLTIASQFQG